MVRETQRISLTVNGQQHHLEVAANTRLIDLLRNQLLMTGTKEGCAVGECGACTIIKDGAPVCSCLALAVQCDDSQIVTIEGLRSDPLGKMLMEEFLSTGGAQCGYCTPGMIMSAWALLKRYSDPTEDQVRDALEGNLCRCTGYQPIIEAIKRVSEFCVNPQRKIEQSH
ncbi:(2Fe-2S)-binding protein [Vibrio parahaemolyticus]|uniref:(2Fe-2S)-binding protein n=1 Tax=Vibrio mediterranei TaxID=689 RepID=UPI0040687C17